MNKVIQALAAVISLFMVACTMDSSSGASYGETNYTRVLSKGDNASIQCNVYVDDNRVVTLLDVDMAMYNSTETVKFEVRAGSPSVYQIDVEATGVLLSDVEDFCAAITEQFSDQNARAECSESEAHGVQQFYSVTSETEINYVVSNAIESGRERCDKWYDNFKKSFREIPGEWGGDAKSTSKGEKASSCDVSLEGNLLTMSVTYPDKSAVMKLSVEGNVYAAVESYTGLDDATLSDICRSYQSETVIRDVACQGSSFSYWYIDSEGSLEDEAVYQKKEVCPALLSGEMTLEDMW